METLNRDAEPLSVLLVDSDPNAAKTTAVLLSLCGFRVSAAASGTEALAASQSDPPDVVLMELSMPGVDGFELARLLGDTIRAKSVRFVALTDRHHRDDYDRATAEGFDGFIVKPADPSDLNRMLDRFADDMDRRGSLAA